MKSGIIFATHRGMYRALSPYIRIVFLVSIFAGSVAGCSLKFGADARQAAENAKKNSNKAVFVDVDNTELEANVVKADDASLQKSEKLPVAKAKKAPKAAAHYVRIGKNRRLRTALSQRLADENKELLAKNHKGVTKGKEKDKKKRIVKVPVSTPTLLYPRVQLFGAKLEQSQWLLSSTELECFLTQPIPRLGRAHFQFNPVQRLRFVFEVDHPIARKLKPNEKRYKRPFFTDGYPYPEIGAKIDSIPPNWKPFAVNKTLGFIPLKEGYKPFILPHRQMIPATKSDYDKKRKRTKSGQQVASLSKNILPEVWPDRLMYELEEGMSIRLTYRDWADGTEDIITTISPISFKKIKGKFEKCISKLPKYDFNKFKKTKLFFTKGQRKLSKKMRSKLRNMVKFIKMDDKIKKVMIKSYTDSMGFKRINRNAAKVQARAIKAYMRKLGMNAPITAIGIGEGRYVASNRSRAGRAKNRRSIITLIK